MDKDEIIDKDFVLKMARQAGFWKDLFAYPEFREHLEAFAKLVAAEVKEALTEQHMNDIWQAIKIEREACAKVCCEIKNTDGSNALAWECAVAIRARRDVVTYGETTLRGQQ